MFVLSSRYDDDTPLSEMSLLEWSTGKKASLAENSVTFSLLEQGWLMKGIVSNWTKNNRTD